MLFPELLPVDPAPVTSVVAQALLSRLSVNAVTELETACGVKASTWVERAPWTPVEQGLQAEWEQSVLRLVIPGVVISDNPERFMVSCVSPAGQLQVLVDGMTSVIQRPLPWA